MQVRDRGLFGPSGQAILYNNTEVNNGKRREYFNANGGVKAIKLWKLQ